MATPTRQDGQDRNRHWLVVINNPTAEDDINIDRARQKGWKVVGQKEMGKEGTEHYQLYVHSTQQRFSGIKHAFPRAHIEVCRNPDAVKQYSQKDETRVGALPQSNNRPIASMADVMILIANNVSASECLITTNEQHDDEFWKSVNSILLDKPGMVSLLIQPNYIRAWRHTRDVWINLAVERTEHADFDDEVNEIQEHDCIIEEDDDIEIPWEDVYTSEEDCPYHSFATKRPDECTCAMGRGL